MGANRPKQFLPLGASTVLQQAIIPFNQLPAVDEIVIVTGEEEIALARQLCADMEKVKDVVAGGAERQDSVYAGLMRATKGLEQTVLEDSLVLIHDGARPYISAQVIMDVLCAAAETGAAVPTVPCKDTVRQRIDGQNHSRTLDRQHLFQVQTPQGFQTGLLLHAMKKAMAEGFTATDDASVVEFAGYPVTMTAGNYANRKLTTKEDLPMEWRTGSGFDVHRLVEGRRLILCGEEISYEKGLLGHSDADVAVHALMDAMLGAADLGDIGRHFPDTDPAYAGISSMKLLAAVRDKLQERGWRLSNADVTIICQRPKLSAHMPIMVQNLAACLDISPDQINVKATTTEKLGFTGRGEGIAAEAVCLLCRNG